MDRDMSYEVFKDNFLISTDPQKLDLEAIQGFLARSYWAAQRPRAVIERSIQNSLGFGLYHHQKQIGFARAITDYATFAYLADVFIQEEYRGQGLGKWLIEIITGYPDLQMVRRWTLATADAHKLYSQYGFTPVQKPENWMERFVIAP
jgi:GNAT superfamily N-acetyltransferase